MKFELLLIDMFTTHIKRINLFADDVLRYMVQTRTHVLRPSTGVRECRGKRNTVYDRYN